MFKTNISIIKTIAHFTAKEIFKSKIILYIFIVSFCLSLLVYVSAEFTYGVGQRVALDFSLGSVSIVANILSIFLGVGLISKEIESRTLYMVLSKPISREVFVLGKVFGLMSVQLSVILILAVCSLPIYFMLGGQWYGIIGWAFFFNFLESFLLLLFAIFFSLFTNTLISVSNTIILLICGHAVNEAASTSFVKNNAVFSFVIKLYGYIFPNFYKLNLKDFVLYQQNIDMNYLINGSLYGITYSVVMLILICKIFKTKDLN